MLVDWFHLPMEPVNGTFQSLAGVYYLVCPDRTQNSHHAKNDEPTRDKGQTELKCQKGENE